MGIIFDIQRFCYHDGPGIRTTVFFKGCQLRCAWCHNPESFRMQPQLRYVSRLCTGCGQCAAECPRQVHRFSEGLHRVDFAACTACGACADSCPSGALKISGYEADPRQVMEVVLRDRPYYGTEGGLTIPAENPPCSRIFSWNCFPWPGRNRFTPVWKPMATFPPLCWKPCFL